MISIYLEVLQWLLNVGLLPECPLSMYPRPDEDERMSAPYPADTLARFYGARRAELKSQLSNENRNRLVDGGDLLFIDNLIDIECNGVILHKQWECDGGNGLYPPPSLQAVLRAYLIEDIDIVHKHCLLIYLFLDLAMTLDQSRYKPIITHLIKFPAVFKLSPSLIKITQAFWQLDHGDFSTAMTQLLDPSVNNEDLKPWHHRIVLKALLLQGQHQHALLYQQVRKPPVSSVQDICIIVTLLIVNDLLQEAFHFQRYNRSYYNEKEILRHFFTVCERMNQQASVLHLPLCSIEENEFISYLKANPNENNKNFLVIYYLQRDRYGEAFQINDYLNENEILKQGLIGQQDKNFRNAIVCGFKKTLPDVTQQLLDYCKKEKDKIIYTTNGEERPVPMSVCVHDSKGQTKYKSTLIQASFQKAKELWSTKLQSPNIENNLNNTPFISTPKIFRFSSERKDSPIIYPAILDSSNMETFNENTDEGATPAKRIKLSPRRSINNESQRLDQFKKRLSCYNSDSLLSTPIVKRRSIRSESITNNQFANNSAILGTPPSILKVRPFVRTSISPENQIRETSTTPEIIEEQNMLEANVKKPNSFGISPRKPIPRTPRPAVHFEERSNSRSSNESGEQSEQHSGQLQIQIDVHREQTPDKSISIDSKNSSRSTDDVFYSPNSSINSSNDNQQVSVEKIEQDTSISLNGSARRSSLKRRANDSVSSRRSYKPLSPVTNIQNTSIRESLRSRRSIVNVDDVTVEPEKPEPKETNIKIIVTEPPAEECKKINQSQQQLASPSTPTTSTPTTNTRLKSRQSLTSKTEASAAETTSNSKESPKIVPKVSGRRSLSRQVLENNLFAKVVATPSPRMSTRLSLTKLTDSDKKRGVEVCYSKSTTSIVKTITDDKIEEKCDIKTIEKKDEFSSEKNDNTLTQVIKHVHNETETKSNVTKVTEILDDDVGATGETSHFDQMNVLSFNSDISESEASHFYKSSPSCGKRYSVLLSTPGSDKNSRNTDTDDTPETMEVSDDVKEKVSDQSEDDDNMEEDKVETTNSHDECIEEMKQTQDETKTSDVAVDEEENVSNQDEDEINIYDDLADEIMECDEVELNSVESEEEIQEPIIEEEEVEERQIAPSSSEDSSQSSDVILIKSSSDDDKSNQSSENSNVSSDKAELIQDNNDDDDEDVEDVDDEENSQSENNEQPSEENEDFDDKLSEIQTNENSNESNDINTSEENFKLTLDEDDEQEQVEIEEENKSTESVEGGGNKSSEEEEIENQDGNKSTIVEKEEEKSKLPLDEPVEEEKVEKEIDNKHDDMMEDINEDNMDKNNEFFINEDIEEMENVEYITEKSSNDCDSTEKQNSEMNTLVEVIHEEMGGNNIRTQEEIQELLFETITQSQEKEANSLDNNVVNLLESIVAEENETLQSEQIKENETKDTVQNYSMEETTNKQQNENAAQTEEMSVTDPLETNVIEISETTIKPQAIEESSIQEAETDPLEQNVIEISETTIEQHKNEESTIQTEDAEITVNPVEQNVIEISKSTIKDPETSVQSEEIMDTSPSNPLEQNIIEISESIIEPHESEENINQTEVTVNPLEQNIIEISESTIKHQETSVQDEEIMDTSPNPLEQNVIEISETTNKSNENEESSMQMEDTTINPLEQNVIETSSSKQDSQKSNEIQTPARRTRSASQHSETKKPEASKTPTRSSTRRRSIDHKIEEELKQKPAQRITKKRSVSVDVHDEPVEKNTEETKTIKTRTRRTSTDETSRKTRASSVINLDIIEEDKPISRTRRAASVDPKTENEKQHQRRGQSVEPETTTATSVKRGRKRVLQTPDIIQEELQSIPEKIEEYSSTHRLTRHQKSIMEKSLVNQQKSRLEKLKEVEQIDPIKLLDKESFTGSPDKDEKTYRAISPASSISTQSSAAVVEHISPSTPKRKRGRPSVSGTPGSSTNTNSTSVDKNKSPGRPRRRSFTQAQEAMAATTPTRARRSSRTASHDQDDAASVVSVSSVMSVPVVQLKQLSEKDFVRHRSLSPTALKEETAAAAKNRRRSTRSSILPTNLSKINEETNPETKEDKPKRVRHRKTDAEGSSSSQSELTNRDSGLKKTLRRSSYKPLENYLPEHTVIKTRKTFRIRKFSRGGSSP